MRINPGGAEATDPYTAGFQAFGPRAEIQFGTIYFSSFLCTYDFAVI